MAVALALKLSVAVARVLNPSMAVVMQSWKTAWMTTFSVFRNQ